MEKVFKLTSRILLAFVLVSIGYGLGRQSAPDATDQSGGAAEQADDAGSPVDRVIIRYFHAAIRCAACNSMEQLLEEVVRENYAAQYADGVVTLVTHDLTQRTDLTTRYGVHSTTPVVVLERGGEEIDHEVMEEPFFFLNMPAEFKGYIIELVDAYLERMVVTGDAEVAP